MILLFAITPIAVLIPVVIVGGVTGAVLWMRRKMEEAKAAEADTAANDVMVEVEEKGADATAKAAKCSLTGTPYDNKRWHSPPPVIAALQKLGYTPTSLTDAAGRAEVIKFQTRAIELKLMGMSKAGAKWIDGVMGPCTLVSLSAAMNMYEAGNWPGA